MSGTSLWPAEKAAIAIRLSVNCGATSEREREVSYWNTGLMYGKQRVRDVVVGVWVQKGGRDSSLSLAACFAAALPTDCQKYVPTRTNACTHPTVCTEPYTGACIGEVGG